MNPPRLIVGLGNPGREYEDNRHNAGAWFVERLAREANVALVTHAKFFGRAGKLAQGDVWLLCPSTYMNRSGQSVAALARFHKIEPNEILVIHDELDVPPGGVRLKQGGGFAGHNGLKDIGANFPTHDFWRLRLGIGHPGDRSEVVNYVLRRPSVDEQSAIDGAIDRCLGVWPKLLAGDYLAAMALLHTKPSSSKSP